MQFSPGRSVCGCMHELGKMCVCCCVCLVPLVVTAPLLALWHCVSNDATAMVVLLFVSTMLCPCLLHFGFHRHSPGNLPCPSGCCPNPVLCLLLS